MRALSLLFLVLLFSSSCTEIRKIPDHFDYGKIQGNTYKNSFFKMEIDIPESWQVKESKELNKFSEEGKEVFTESDNPTLEKVVELSEITSANLVGLFKYPDDTLIIINPSIICVAENVNYSMVNTPEAYLNSSKSLLEQTSLGYQFEDGYYTKIIDGKEFLTMKASIPYGFMTMYQHYTVMVENGFALSFISTFENKEDEVDLNTIIENITFDE